MRCLTTPLTAECEENKIDLFHIKAFTVKKKVFEGGVTLSKLLAYSKYLRGGNILKAFNYVRICNFNVKSCS